VTPSEVLIAHAGDAVCHLQTIGRTSGRPRTIEIWFATDGTRIYLLAGGRDRAHWVRNLRADPHVRVRIGGRTFDARARVISVSPARWWRDACWQRNTRVGPMARRSRHGLPVHCPWRSSPTTEAGTRPMRSAGQ
jgi:deazaflavin-dependent oxidoreductase (nitroreductase family)